MKLFVTLLLGLLLAGCNDDKSASPSAPGSGWSILWSTGLPPQMPVGSDGRPYFDFPQSDGVHYVVAQRAASLGQSVTMHFAIVGSGSVVPSERSGDGPAKVRLMIQQAGDTLTAEEPYKRWWSMDSAEISAAGEFTLSVQLTPDKWTSVFGTIGTDAPGQFENCLANLGQMGFTFGAMYAGHGVYANGPMRFVLRSFTVQ